jgi:HlyD family secretion protein
MLFIKNKKLIIAVVLCTSGILAAIGVFFYYDRQKVNSIPSPANSNKAINFISAVGRLEPKGRLITLAPFPSQQGGSKVSRLLVREGDTVRPNQVVAILDNNELQKIVVERSKSSVKVAKANLVIVKAGAKKGEINAQKATISRLEAELKSKLISKQATINRLQVQLLRTKQEGEASIKRLKAELENAILEYDRRQELLKKGAIPKTEVDQRLLTVKVAKERVKEAQVNTNKSVEATSEEIKEETANLLEIKETLAASIQEAKATLARILDVREVDIKKAVAEIEQAQSGLKQSIEDLNLTYVRSPQAGQILKINSYPGEYVNTNKGILELGEIEKMVAIVEVHESDIRNVKLQKTAIISSENNAFEGEIKGKVNRIGLKIGKKNILGTDPAADVDARVVEVEIALNPQDIKLISQLTYSRILAKILI